MKISLKLKNPREMEATLTLTMTLEDWETFAKQLPGSYPSWAIDGAIRAVILQATERFDQEVER